MRKPVSVITHTDADGRVRPMSIVLDGRYYPVDTLLSVDRADRLKRGDVGMRYRIRISNQEYNLWCIPRGTKEFWELEKVDI